MKILCLGDVVGRPGRRAIELLLRPYVKEHAIDLVVANGENAAAGSGITPKIFRDLRAHGVGCVTLGDHFHRRQEILPVLDQSDRLLRPANLSPRAPGKPFSIVPVSVEGKEVRICVFALVGRTFMSSLPGGDPFDIADRVLAAAKAQKAVVVADLHAEATGEKRALGYHLAGRASVAFGTHTHVPTADAEVLAGGTAYITDVGMCGPYDSVLGRRKEAVLSWMGRQVTRAFEVATGDVRLCGMVAEVDVDTGRATACERVELRLEADEAAYDIDDKRG